MAVSLVSGSSNGSPVFDPHILGGSVGARAMALTDGTDIATNGIARAVDLSAASLTTPVPASISASGHTSDIDVAPFSNLFWYVSVGAPTGGATSPTLDVYFDYSDGAGGVIASGVVHLVQFTGAGGTYSNVGPVAGGGGFIIPTAAQIRWVVGSAGGSPVFPVTMKLAGR